MGIGENLSLKESRNKLSIHLRYIIKHPEDIPPRLTQKKFIIYIAKKETPVKI